jgi:RNA polymerase sigma-70 factor (ECF subfamily)
VSLEPAHLAEIITRGRHSWPTVPVPRRLEEFVHRCLPADVRTEEWLARAPLADMYLASACAEGAPVALAEFERAFVSQVPQYIARLKPTPELLDEVKQRLRERLFVGAADGRAKIREYSARGPLGGWVRVIAMRLALDLLDARASASPEKLEPASRSTSEMEAEYVKRRYGAALQNALTQAIAEIAPEQRHVLRLHFAEGVTLDRMGEILGKHRVTVCRQIAAARRAIIEATRRIMLADMAMPASEFDSLIRVVRSQLEIHLSRP